MTSLQIVMTVSALILLFLIIFALFLPKAPEGFSDAGLTDRLRVSRSYRSSAG